MLRSFMSRPLFTGIRVDFFCRVLGFSRLLETASSSVATWLTVAAATLVAAVATLLLVALLIALWHVDIGQRLEVEGVQHVPGVLIDRDRRLRLESRDLGHVVVTAFAFFLLEFNRDATHGSRLNAFHQVSDETSDLIAQTLRRNDGDLLDHAFIRMKVQRELGVVFLDDLTRCLLYGFRTNTTHLVLRMLIEKSK